MTTTTARAPLAIARSRRLSALRSTAARAPCSALILTPPVCGWSVIYFGSLVAALRFGVVASRPETTRHRPQPSLENFRRSCPGQPSTWTVALRTVSMAAHRDGLDAVIAFPLAYYMARVASPRRRQLLTVLIGAAALVELPRPRLRVADDPGAERAAGLGRSQQLGLQRAPGRLLATCRMDRLHLPLAAVHDPAAVRGPRAHPGSYFEASSDLGAPRLDDVPPRDPAARMPAVVAGSIFTFSLTLGDYITPPLVIEQPVHRQRRSTTTRAWPGTCRSRPRTRSCPS